MTPGKPTEKDPKWAKIGATEALGYWLEQFDKPVFTYFIGERPIDLDDTPHLHRTPDAVKIGHALDPIARLNGLQCGNPRRLVLEAVLLGGAEVEHAWHKRWEGARLIGEWFGAGYQEAIITAAKACEYEQITAHMDGQRTGIEWIGVIDPNSRLELAA